MRQSQVRDDVQLHALEQRGGLRGEELAVRAHARVRNDEADVEICGRSGELLEKILVGEIRLHRAVPHAELSGEIAADLLENGDAAGHEHDVQPVGRELPGEFLADPGRGAGDDRPGTKDGLVDPLHSSDPHAVKLASIAM